MSTYGRTQPGETKCFNWNSLYADTCQNIGLGINPEKTDIRDMVLQKLLNDQIVRNGRPGSSEIIFEKNPKNYVLKRGKSTAINNLVAQNNAHESASTVKVNYIDTLIDSLYWCD